MSATAVFVSPRPDSTDRLLAVTAHLGTFAAWFLAPLAVWLVKRGESRYVEYQALQALLWSCLGTLVSLVTCGIALPVFMIVHVVAAVRTSDGVPYDYPFVADLAKSWLVTDDV
ncbi:MAG: DUF4870 domain-containing protein [Polyangiaceae bacterium]